ncbi:MAG: hypothetical protein HOP37_14900 [Cyclobacteriaceae bacterium]|nr:hypothetical protein [Cyclobacteriaceae bacterium]
MKSNFEYSLENSPALHKTIDLNLAVVKDHVVTLTPKGKLLADQIAIDLFA